jgi:hypothetical protein
VFEQGEMKKAGFNVEIEKWEKFKQVARANNSDTNKEIRKFIDRYLSENSQLALKLNKKGK